MTNTFALIDDVYSANGADSRKRLFGSVSTTTYSAGGESITVSSYFPNKFLGGTVCMINPSVTVDLAGIMSTGIFRGTNTSTTSVLLQFFTNALPGAATIGRMVDNTVSAMSNATCYVEMVGY